MGLLVVAGLGTAPAASAAPCAGGTTEWDTAVSGDWNVDANWSNGAPSSACDVNITLPGTYTVTLGGALGGVDSATVKSLSVGGATGTQTLVLHGINGTGNTTLTAIDGVTNDVNGSILIDCQTPAMPCVGGTGSLTVTAGTLTNAGTITTTPRGSTAQLAGNFTNTTSGTLQINQGNSAYVQGSAGPPDTLTNQGTIALADQSTLSTSRTVTNGAGGDIAATGSGSLLTGGTFNQGAGTTSASAVVFEGSGLLNFTGTGASSFLIQEGGTFGLSGDIGASQAVTIHGVNGTGDITVIATTGFTNAGSILIDCQTPAIPCAGGVASLTLTSGTLTNTGTITTSPRGATAQLDGNITNSGTLQINKGNTNVTGNYTQGATGTLAAEVQGTGAGQFSQLGVTGNATLDGVLLMRPIGGYETTALLTDSIPVLDYTGTRTGNFCGVSSAPALAGGKHFHAVPNNPATRVDAVVMASAPATCPQPPPQLPVNVTPPTITGRMFYQQRVGCLPGAWANSPTSFSYRWDVATAPNNPVFDGPSFLVPFIFNAWLRDQVVTCTVTATNAAGSATASATARTECRGEEGFPIPELGRCHPSGFDKGGRLVIYPVSFSENLGYRLNPDGTFTAGFGSGGTTYSGTVRGAAVWYEIKSARRVDVAGPAAAKRVRVRVPLRPRKLKVKLKGPLDHVERTLRVPQRVINELRSGTQVTLQFRTEAKRRKGRAPRVNVQRAPLVLGG